MKNLIYIIILFNLLTGLTSISSSVATGVGDDLFQQGMELYNSGQYPDALNMFIRTLNVNPKHKQAKEYLQTIIQKIQVKKDELYTQAQTAVIKGDKKKAIRYLELAVKLAPEDKKISDWLSELRGAKPVSYTSPDEINRMNKLIAEEHFQTALKYVNDRDFLPAEIELKLVLEYEPGHQPTKLLLTEVSDKLNLEISNEEKESLTFASVREYYVTGMNAVRNKDFTQAVEQYQQVLKLTAHSKTVRYLERVQTWIIQEENKRVTQNRFNSINKSIVSVYETGTTDQLNTVINQLQEILNLNPDLVFARLWQSKIQNKLNQQTTINTILNSTQNLSKAQRYSELMDLLEKVFSLDETNNRAGEILSKITVELGADSIVNTDFETCVGLADKYFKDKKYEFAVKYWAKSVNLYPQSNLARIGLRNSLYQKEQVKKEKDKIQQRKRSEEWIQEKSNRIDEYRTQAKSHRQKGEHQQAMVYWEKILELDSGNVSAKEGIITAKKELAKQIPTGVNTELIESYYKQGLLAFTQSKYEEAIFHWRKVLELVPNHEKAKANIRTAEEKLRIAK